MAASRVTNSWHGIRKSYINCLEVKFHTSSGKGFCVSSPHTMTLQQIQWRIKNKKTKQMTPTNWYVIITILPPVSGHQQWVQESVFAGFKVRLDRTRFDVDQVHVHPAPSQRHEFRGTVQAEVRHVLIHNSCGGKRNDLMQSLAVFSHGSALVQCSVIKYYNTTTLEKFKQVGI